MHDEQHPNMGMVQTITGEISFRFEAADLEEAEEFVTEILDTTKVEHDLRQVAKERKEKTTA